MRISRREARIKVLNVLYAHWIGKDPIGKVKKDLIADVEDADKLLFINKLIDVVINNVKEFDKLIKDKLDNWEFSRIAMIDKIAMRMALAEMLFFPEIPTKVTINEAIDIAKEYSTKTSGSFINGILDSINVDLTKNKKLNKTGRGLLDIKSKRNEK